MSLPLFEMGAMAARRIIDTPSGTGSGAPPTTMLSHRLIPRDTTARRLDHGHRPTR